MRPALHRRHVPTSGSRRLQCSPYFPRGAIPPSLSYSSHSPEKPSHHHSPRQAAPTLCFTVATPNLLANCFPRERKPRALSIATSPALRTGLVWIHNTCTCRITEFVFISLHHRTNLIYTIDFSNTYTHHIIKSKDTQHMKTCKFHFGPLNSSLIGLKI